MKPGRMLILLISITPASTSAAPPICHQVNGSFSSQTPKKIVRMGPSVPISAVLERVGRDSCKKPQKRA